MGDRIIQYSPAGPTVAAFHRSHAFVRGIMGPIGSGKSTACVLEILRRAQAQLPGPDGKRRSRWAIVRNSYPELKTTTLKTWGEWCPPQFGRLTMDSPIRHHVVTKELDMEVFFMALDRDEDVRKLLSLELTGAWINEAREVPKAILDALTGRVGRYPAMIQGGATWSGITMDTNPPDDQSWWYNAAECETPHGWEFFHQPGADTAEAENLLNLPGDYYSRLIPGKDEDWIKVYVKGEYGFLIEGKPVYPMYRDRFHAAKEVLEASPALPILIGADFGLTPAAVLTQHMANGQWRIIDEYITDSCGVIRFAELVLQYCADNYPKHALILPKDFLMKGSARPIQGFGDPAGNVRGQNDEKTAIDIMKEYTAWPWKTAPTNDFTMRREVVVAALNRAIDGEPGILVSPKAKMIRKGFSSGYHYKFIRSANGSMSQVHETPAKNEYSHPHDGLQYVLLGGGEAGVVMRKQNRSAASGGARKLQYDVLGG